MAEDSQMAGAGAVPVLPNMVTLLPIKSMNPRRLSTSCYARPCRSNQPVALLSIQGLLVNREEVASAEVVSFSRDNVGELNNWEGLAWELLTPFHRILVVAAVAVAAFRSEKNREIQRLKKSVKHRDEILANMQQKLDSLCEQVNIVNGQPESIPESACTHCWLCVQHQARLSELQDNAPLKSCAGIEIFKGKTSLQSEAEQEERRMSDLSDWASSVTSTAEIQLESLAIEQDVYNLKKECEEKDAAIKELSDFIRSEEYASSKRIDELEDVVRQKTKVITKLRKDISVLEQKVVQLTREKRASYTGSNPEPMSSPMMIDNLLFNLDSSTSPSSSDSDTSNRRDKKPLKTLESPSPLDINDQMEKFPISEVTSKRVQESAPSRISTTSPRSYDLAAKSQAAVSPFKENKPMNMQRSSLSKKIPLIGTGGVHAKRSRRKSTSGLMVTASEKRWV